MQVSFTGMGFLTMTASMAYIHIITFSKRSWESQQITTVPMTRAANIAFCIECADVTGATDLAVFTKHFFQLIFIAIGWQAAYKHFSVSVFITFATLVEVSGIAHLWIYLPAIKDMWP